MAPAETAIPACLGAAALCLPLVPALGADVDGCETRQATQAVEERLDAAEAAFSDLDIEAFLAAHDQAREHLDCVEAVVDTALSARLHRVEGLRAFGERDVFAVRAFAAARALDPNYRFPTSLVPEASPIYDDWDAMDLAAGGLETLPEPAAGELRIDGIATRERPDAWPTVIQWIGDDGTPAFTAYLRHDDAPPDYPVADATAQEPDPTVAAAGAAETTAPTPTRRTSPRVPLLVGAGAAAVTTGVLTGLGASSRSAFFDRDTPDAELDALRARTNGLAAAATVTGVAAVGLGVGVFVTW